MEGGGECSNAFTSLILQEPGYFRFRGYPVTRVLLFSPSLVILQSEGQQTGNCLISGGFNGLGNQKERDSPFVHLL